MSSALKPEIIEMAMKYAEMRKYKFLPDESTNKTLIFLTANGTKAKATPKGIQSWFDFKAGKKDSINTINNVFKIEAPVKVKKQWKAISCSMTTDELAVIDKLMKDNNIKTYNKFIRLVLLKVIEANK